MQKKLLFLLWAVQGLANAGQNIPEEIAVPAGNVVAVSLHAKGSQRYLCTLNEKEYVWQFQGPDAQLFNEQGHQVGVHGAGPVWKYKDGSSVRAKVKAQLPRAASASIPWLLLMTVEHEGKGLFEQVSFIQRVNTQGGLLPDTPCNANHLGGEKAVPYSADYIFYKPKLN